MSKKQDRRIAALIERLNQEIISLRRQVVNLKRERPKERDRSTNT